MSSLAAERAQQARTLYQSQGAGVVLNNLPVCSHRAVAASVLALWAHTAGFGDDIFGYIRSLPNKPVEIRLYKVQFNHEHQGWVADGLMDQFPAFRAVSAELHAAFPKMKSLVPDWDVAWQMLLGVSSSDALPVDLEAWEDLKTEFRRCYDFWEK